VAGKNSPPPPPPPAGAPKAAAKKPTGSLKVSTGKSVNAHKVVVYGSGGVGKTELVNNLQKLGLKVLFLDIDDETLFLEADRINISSFDDLMDALSDKGLLAPYDVVAVDSFTKVEALCEENVLETVKTSDGNAVRSIEGYGYGKGYKHLYDKFMEVLAALDAIARDGKHVIGTAHDCTTNVPNPNGEDWLQYQPRLQSPKNVGKIRERVKEWCYHLLYIELVADVVDGKAYGGGRRIIHTNQKPTHWAKSRNTAETVDYEHGSPDIWKILGVAN
jgi:hypothetical protein